jgi:hypothetical protein
MRMRKVQVFRLCAEVRVNALYQSYSSPHVAPRRPRRIRFRPVPRPGIAPKAVCQLELIEQTCPSVSVTGVAGERY